MIGGIANVLPCLEYIFNHQRIKKRKYKRLIYIYIYIDINNYISLFEAKRVEEFKDISVYW